MQLKDAFLYDIVRTPRGFGHTGGALYELKPVDILAAILEALRQRTGIDPNLIEDVIIGCAHPVDDQGFNIAKAALLSIAWPNNISGMQLSRHCASGLEAINLAATKIRSGWGSLFLAGGMESMSRIPGKGHGSPVWHDAELLAESSTIPLGLSADLVATMEGFSREALDNWATRSHEKARQAWQSGYFSKAVIPIYDLNGLPVLLEDEFLKNPNPSEALVRLLPAFAESGAVGFDGVALQRFPEVEAVRHLHTQGNTAFAADGACVALLGDRSTAGDLKARAKIIAIANVCEDPIIGLAAAAKAAKRALEFAKLNPSAVDLWECSELFAADALKFQHDMGIDENKLNVNGGAIAMGYPLGAHSAIMLGTLLDELERRDLKIGVTATYTHGGMGVATIIERI